MVTQSLSRKTGMVGALLVAFMLIVSSPSITTCQVSARDKIDLGSNVDDEAWKHFIDRRVADEVAGRKPPINTLITWKQYWASCTTQFVYLRVCRGSHRSSQQKKI